MRTPSQAWAAAKATLTNQIGFCQAVTRGWLDAPSAGDFDGDGAADAEDGWKKEPLSARRSDRKPPKGYPVTYLGGSHDNGHRALSAGPIDGVWHIRSTDAGGPGRVATVPLSWPETHWGLTYAGWSTTMDGVPIPPDAKPKPLSKGWRVDQAEKLVDRAKRKPGTKRAAVLKRIAALFDKL